MTAILRKYKYTELMKTLSSFRQFAGQSPEDINPNAIKSQNTEKAKEEKTSNPKSPYADIKDGGIFLQKEFKPSKKRVNSFMVRLIWKRDA